LQISGGKYKNNDITIEELAKEVLANQNFWKRDLNELPGLTEGLIVYLNQIEEDGVKKSLKNLLR